MLRINAKHGVKILLVLNSAALKQHSDRIQTNRRELKKTERSKQTFNLINHVQQRKGGSGGDKGDTHITSPQPYQSQTKEEEGEGKTESWHLFTLSIMSGRLVAASTVTSRSCSTPSISVRS